MTPYIRRAAIVAIAFVGSVSVAFAQPTVPGAGNVGSPPLSPYLNLLRNNSNNANPAFNYLTITRPQMQFNQAANQLNQQLQNTNAQLQQQQGQIGILGGDGSMPVTGHAATFGNLGGHFGNLGGVGNYGRLGGSQMGMGMMNRPGGMNGSTAGMGARAAAPGVRR